METPFLVDRGRAEGPPPPPPPQPPDPAPVVLRRTKERVIAGVCGGFARYLGVDAAVVRVAFVLLTLFGGSGVLLYLVCMIVIPEESPTDHVGQVNSSATPEVMRGAVGMVLIVVGLVTLIARGIPGLSDYIGPALLIGLGVLVLMIEGRR